MKKLIIIGFLLMIICQACYEDYKKDFEYSTTYFALQRPHRIFIEEAGKEMSFEIGVVLAGKYVNDVEETVYFEVDPAMMDDHPTKALLPESYYTLSDAEKFVIPAGEFLGKITVTLNESFLADPDATTLNYILPLRITDATTDSILSDKSTTKVAVEFENQYYGAYWVTGSDFLVNLFGTPYDTIVYSEPDLVKNNYRILETESRNTSIVEYLGFDISGNNTLNLAVSADGSVVVTPKSTTNLTDISGTGTYNKEDRVFYLDYNYQNPDDFTRHHVMDTLIFFDTPQSVKEW